MSDPQAEQNFLALKNKSYEIKFDLNETKYKPLENIGTGAYGVVCSALHTGTDEKVAIKKIPDIFEEPRIAKRTYREIKILKHLKHDNIIAIREILKPKGAVENLTDVYIVLDLMETDLHRIIHSKQDLTEEHVRYFLYQILRGLKYIHSANIIHRDLKPSNLLVNENCDLKIGDFGMARAVSSDPDEYNMLMTQYVATRWYRAPELMMARLAYTGAVDMWSVGCIFAEMLGRKQIFPGRDYRHQLRLIIGVLGTPPKEFIKLTQSDLIKTYITGGGSKQPIPLNTMYPKANPEALDLLRKMLQISPQTRISVLQALKDPFLRKYHDPLDEPVCVPAFDFAFEKEETSLGALKEAVIKEIMEYHKVEEKPKILFDFRPVPKDLIQAKSTKNTPGTPIKSAEGTLKEMESHKVEEKPKILFDFRPVPKDQIQAKPAKNMLGTPKKSAEGDGNFGLDSFLKEIRDQSTYKSAKDSNAKTSANEKLSGLSAFLQSQPNNKEFSNKSKQLPAFLSMTSPTGHEAGFKVPVGLPLSEMKKLKVKPEDGVDTLAGQSDVEMLSAKSDRGGLASGQLSVSAVSSAGHRDVEMLSANKAKEEDIKSEEKTVNTKEVLKAAILSAALRKQKGELVQKPKPMTALQRQREREDKKRKKMEKVMERKKKQKQKQKDSSSINLSEEDKNLLEKWSKMQSLKEKNLPSTNVPNVPETNPQFVQPSLNLTINTLPVTIAQAAQNPVNTMNIPSTQVISKIVNPIESFPANSSGQIISQTAETYDSITNPLETLLDVLSEDSNSLGSTGFGQSSESHIIESNQQVSTGNSHIFTNSSQIHTELPHNIHTTGDDSHFPVDLHVNQNIYPSTSQIYGKNNSIDKKFEHQTSNPSSRLPPTYSEAISAKLQGNMSPEHHAQSGLPFVTAPTTTQNSMIQAANINTDKPPLTNTTAESNFLPFQSYQTSNDNPSQTMYSTQLPLPQSEEMVCGGRDSEGQMLSVITRQMMRSHVDDLTLTMTPKGTGGGYGVGLDLEAVMSDAFRELTSADRSAPLSATESLIGDWLEVSGMKGLDAKDYEALERELGLGSPINLNDIVTSPS